MWRMWRGKAKVRRVRVERGRGEKSGLSLGLRKCLRIAGCAGSMVVAGVVRLEKAAVGRMYRGVGFLGEMGLRMTRIGV